MYNHPFYDDFGFSVRIHHVWTDTGSVAEAVREAWRNMLSTRQTWQGNYTATFLSGIQPGVFDEDLYFLTTCILLTSLIAGCAALIAAALRRLLNADWAAVALIASLLLFLIVQMTPAVDEAYFWFNGGIGYTFNYALLALARIAGHPPVAMRNEAAGGPCMWRFWPCCWSCWAAAATQAACLRWWALGLSDCWHFAGSRAGAGVMWGLCCCTRHALCTA